MNYRIIKNFVIFKKYFIYNTVYHNICTHYLNYENTKKLTKQMYSISFRNCGGVLTEHKSLAVQWTAKF